jgi:hypothetical protein
MMYAASTLSRLPGTTTGGIVVEVKSKVVYIHVTKWRKREFLPVGEESRHRLMVGGSTVPLVGQSSTKGHL